VLAVLKWSALGAAAVAYLVHLASFAVPVNSNPLQLGLVICVFVFFAGGIYSFPRDDTDTDGNTTSLKASAWRYVPGWMRIPPIVAMVYATAGVLVQLPGMNEFSVMNAPPLVARWVSALDAAFLVVSAVMFYGSEKIREMEFLKAP